MENQKELNGKLYKVMFANDDNLFMRLCVLEKKSFLFFKYWKIIWESSPQYYLLDNKKIFSDEKIQEIINLTFKLLENNEFPKDNILHTYTWIDDNGNRINTSGKFNTFMGTIGAGII